MNVPEDRFDEALEAIYEEAVQLYGPERERIARDFASKLAQEGVAEIPAEQLDAVIATIDWQAWSSATDRAISGWIRSLDPDSGVPKNYSVANRLAEQGPLPSTIQAAREQGWDPGPLRSPAEAVRAHDYRKSGSVTSRMFGDAPVWE